MARKGRITKIQAEAVNPSPTVPDSQTEPPVNAKDVNSIGVISDEELQETQSPRRKNTRTTTTLVVRRSERLTTPPPQTKSIEPVVEDIIIVEADKDEENHLHEEHEGDKTQDEQSEKEETAVETTPPGVNLNYRSMYIASQKKVGKLMKKNRQLRKNLEYAHGQIKVYAEMTPIVSSLSKANENLCNRPWSTKRLRT